MTKRRNAVHEACADGISTAVVETLADEKMWFALPMPVLTNICVKPAADTVPKRSRRSLASRLWSEVAAPVGDGEGLDFNAFDHSDDELENITAALLVSGRGGFSELTARALARAAHDAYDSMTARSECVEVGGGSQPPPFHNWRHAVDVLQAASLISDGLKPPIVAAERRALLVAALLHDVGHPGRSNAYVEVLRLL